MKNFLFIIIAVFIALFLFKALMAIDNWSLKRFFIRKKNEKRKENKNDYKIRRKQNRQLLADLRRRK